MRASLPEKWESLTDMWFWLVYEEVQCQSSSVVSMSKEITHELRNAPSQDFA